MIPTLAQDTAAVLVSGEQTGGRFAIIEARERHGAESPRHIHSREDEFIYILDGCLKVHCDGEAFVVRAGSLLSLPRGSEHVFIVESLEARLLVLLSPAGLEDYLTASEAVGPSGSESQAAERLVALAAEYGVAITGPANHAGPPVAPRSPNEVL